MKRANVWTATCVMVWAGASAWGQPAQVKIALGNSHGVLLEADGSLWAWGSNDSGQLGIGEDHSWAAVAVPGMNGIRDAAAGDGFTVAVRNDGTVWAWGGNEQGELGDGGGKPSRQPKQVAALSGIVAVAAAGQHALALSSSGAVWAWGQDPVQDRASSPHQVADLANVMAIAASTKHSVALKRDGTIWVWGNHGAGDLGNGTYGLSAAPMQLAGLSDVIAVAAGYQLTLALKKDGTVWAVGYGAAGQLGNGSTESSIKPVKVAGLPRVKAVAAGAMHVVALGDDGAVWSWGNSHDGQLGNTRVSADQSTKPVRTGTLTGVVAIAAASNHSAAVTNTGVAWAWGQNEHGALGVDPDSLERSEVPMRVGQSVPGQCTALFSCQTGSGKFIRICGTQDLDHVDKWSGIQYRYGADQGPPELIYPADPAAARPSLFFSHEAQDGEYRVSIRFSNGAYTYRVFSGSSSGAGVEVDDAKGKKLSTIACAERPEMYADYLRVSLPCDLLNPHGAAACKENPYSAK